MDTQRLARFEPVRFDPAIVSLISRQAQQRGARCKTMTSGAGHDAQMLARICPTAMIFTLSIGGVSHNPAEATADADLETGANILLDVLLELSA